MPVVAHPGASRTRVAWDGEALQVWVTAPAHEGRANAALVRAIATACRVRPSQVELVSGAGQRRKLIRIAGAEPGVLGDLATPGSS